MGNLNISNKIKILKENPPSPRTVPVHSVGALDFYKCNPKEYEQSRRYIWIIIKMNKCRSLNKNKQNIKSVRRQVIKPI